MINKFNAIDYSALCLLVIGGLNWGLIGIFNFNLVAAIFGAMSLLSKIVYGIVGISALYAIYKIATLSYWNK